ncbi:MAG: dihydrolipoyl dehydrogenase [Deltaproteobacteria bacterium]|nr:dihydrolipoyl dehydrogenase [Deltaproteobacteria bacterium]
MGSKKQGGRGVSDFSSYDVIIIGAGPGGYVAGIRAAQLGLKVCIIEKDKPGGICLNWGCIPSKSLIHQARLYNDRHELERMGLAIDTRSFDYGRVQKKSREATQHLNAGVEYLLKKNKVDLIQGTARIASRNKVVIQGSDRTIEGRNIIIATGSRPAEIPGFEFDEKQVLSSTGILSMMKLPQSLIILGAGAIGCEFAYVMSSFGVKVTLVEMAPHVLPFEDAEVAGALENSFKQSGIRVLTATHAVSLEKTDTKVVVSLVGDDGKQQKAEAEKALCVFGRKPNTDDIGLESIGLKTEKGYIPVGDYYETSVKGVFAIGDVVATPLLAHVASKEGEIAVEHIAGRKPRPRVDVNAIPSAIYCAPQVASFGLRESQLQEKGVAYKKALFPYRAVGKAVAIDHAEGMAKLLYDPETQEILGCHIIGHDATELIHEVLLAKSSELLPEDVAGMVHAHPTISEVVMEMAKAVNGEAIHL